MNNPYELWAVIGMLWFIACLMVWVGLALWKHRQHHYSMFRLGGLMMCLGSVATYLALAGERGWSLPPSTPILIFDAGFSVLIAFRIYDEKYCDCEYPEIAKKSERKNAFVK